MVIPPIYHLGYPTLGISWFQNKPSALALAARLGITVPFDATTPVAPYGSMFIARPQALRSLTAGDFRHDDFPDEGGYKDGALTHVVERLFAYAALSAGFHVREVLDPHLAAVNYKALEFRGVALGEVLGPFPRRALKRVQRLKQVKAAAERADQQGGPLRGGLRRAGAALRRTPARGDR